jgi:hypothetical protein
MQYTSTLSAIQGRVDVDKALYTSIDKELLGGLDTPEEAVPISMQPCLNVLSRDASLILPASGSGMTTRG